MRVLLVGLCAGLLLAGQVSGTAGGPKPDPAKPWAVYTVSGPSVMGKQFWSRHATRAEAEKSIKRGNTRHFRFRVFWEGDGPPPREMTPKKMTKSGKSAKKKTASKGKKRGVTKTRSAQAKKKAAQQAKAAAARKKAQEKARLEYARDQWKSARALARRQINLQDKRLSYLAKLQKKLTKADKEDPQLNAAIEQLNALAPQKKLLIQFIQIPFVDFGPANPKPQPDDFFQSWAGKQEAGSGGARLVFDETAPKTKDDVKAAVKGDPFLDRVVRHEGLRDTSYLDSVKILTAGVGYNLQKEGAKEAIEKLGLDYYQVLAGTQRLNADQILTLLKESVAGAIASAPGLVENYDQLPEPVKEVVVEMIFQLGPHRFEGFENLREALAERDYARAAREMKNSKWYKQVPKRAKTLIDIVKVYDKPKAKAKQKMKQKAKAPQQFGLLRSWAPPAAFSPPVPPLPRCFMQPSLLSQWSAAVG